MQSMKQKFAISLRRKSPIVEILKHTFPEAIAFEKENHCKNIPLVTVACYSLENINMCTSYIRYKTISDYNDYYVMKAKKYYIIMKKGNEQFSSAIFNIMINIFPK